MPIRPSVAQSYKHLILLIFCIFASFSVLNKFWDFIYEVTDALHNFFSSSLQSSITDFAYSFLLFTNKMSICFVYGAWDLCAAI
jgi:hypothetical protein